MLRHLGDERLVAIEMFSCAVVFGEKLGAGGRHFSPNLKLGMENWPPTFPYRDKS